MIGRAVLAPSSHNTQPWFFRLSESAIDLCADRTRALPVNDPEDRELTISCGCALMNLRIAAASAGLHVQVRLLPKPEELDLLARVSLSNLSDVSAEDAQLADFIETRRTYRKRFAPREVSASALDQLNEATKREGARLVPLLTEEVRQKLAALVAEGDAAQWGNPSWRRELAAWMHPRRRGDGLTMPALAVPVAQLVVRTFDMGGGVGAKDRQLAEASPLIAVLSTDSDHPRDWLLAGQALQRTLLIGCRHGLQASYLNQPVQVASLRPKLQNLVSAGFPQILLRIGYPVEEIPPAPRRALDDVIE
ncbi:MAG: nitroreductase [Nitrospira sp.]|nr:nitroreductase [Nitrospira sp.]